MTDEQMRIAILRAANIEHGQILVAIRDFAVEAFMRGDDRSAVVARDLHKLILALVGRRYEAVRQSLGLPMVEHEGEDAT